MNTSAESAASEGRDPAATPSNELRTALLDANIPTLVAVLAHLTGDDRWLADPYRPTRTKGLSDHPDGGLAEQAQRDIRDAVADLIERGETEPAVGINDVVGMARIMSSCMGEPVAEAYVPLMAEEMGLQPRMDLERFESLPGRGGYSVSIVGAGASGICMGIALKQAGIPFTIYEKNDDLGGTWFENRYPDCGVDTPSYWYSYTFQTSNWSRYYSKRDDVFAYFRRTAEEFGLIEHIQFGSTVESAVFDEDQQQWTLGVRDSAGVREVTSTFMVTAVGQLNRPKVPTIEGAETFAGAQFHSAAWPDGLDLTGKKVAVVGTGASAMQLVPAIYEQVDHLTIYQRSPQWIAPNNEYNRTVSSGTQYLMEHVPFYAAWYRMRQVWSFGDKIFQSLIIDPEWQDSANSINSINAGYRKYFENYMREQLADRPDLLEAALPDYPPFGKRMLLDNGWFDAIKAPNVDLRTTGVAQLTPTQIVDVDGVATDVDVVIYATGFDTLNLLGPVDVVGRGGQHIHDAWGDDDAQAYLGITESGFPNLFFLYGPNTNLGHGGSLLFIVECQTRYVIDLMYQAIAAGAGSVECREEVRDAYVTDVDAAHQKLIWTHPGMDTWYRNAAGRVVTNSPWTLLDLWSSTRSADLSDYDVEPQHRAAKVQQHAR